MPPDRSMRPRRPFGLPSGRQIGRSVQHYGLQSTGDNWRPRKIHRRSYGRDNALAGISFAIRPSFLVITTATTPSALLPVPRVKPKVAFPQVSHGLMDSSPVLHLRCAQRGELGAAVSGRLCFW